MRMAMPAESLVQYRWLKLLLGVLLLAYVECEMECLNPPEPANGTYEILGGPSKRLTVGTLVTFSCDPGYEPGDNSASNLICALDQAGDEAIWTGKVPSCQEIKNCKDPGVSKHGTREGNCCSEGDVLWYSCQEDFELVGPEEIVCLSTNNWSHSRPLCKPMNEDHCELPPEISHGNVIVVGEKEGDYFLPYDEVGVLCEAGYTYNGSSKFIMCEEGGKWKAEFRECIEVYCPHPEPLSNGTILELVESTLESFSYNFEISYVCDKGYRLLGGDSWRICRENGWSGKVPYCEEIRCPDPGVLENGDLEGSNFGVGAKVRFKCSSGYDLLGSVERYCMPNGQWTGELARCDTSKNYCPNPGTPINGFKNCSRYDLEDKVWFRCQSGYIQVGSEVRECLANRTWSGTETKCLSPYDFDNIAQLGEMLKSKMEEEFTEEQGEHIPLGRTLDLNFPGRIILYFAFDVSGSVGNRNFRRSIDIAKSIVRKVGVSANGTRVGALTFSRTGKFAFSPINLDNTEDVLNELDKIKYTGERISGKSALQIIRNNLNIDKKWLGENRKTSVFLITDGKANMGGSPEREAKLLKKSGVDIYCIGITGDVRVDLLYKIASSSLYAGVERPNVFILENYHSVLPLIQMITNDSLDYSRCGIGMENEITFHKGRVVGGKESFQPWPWMAALFFDKRKKEPNQAHIHPKCGGSIIRRNFILTAAHCMYRQKYRIDKSEILVILGLTDIDNETFAQEFEVKMILIHPKYYAGYPYNSYDYDIALLQLDRPVVYTAYIRPICLPPKDLLQDTRFYRSEELVWATGWGHVQNVSLYESLEKEKMSKILKKIIVPIQSRERCKESLSNVKRKTFFFIPPFTERMFCAGDGNGNDTCFGDSGGPLMQPHMNGEGNLYWTQVGIVSWGVGCGVKDTYGIYSHVHNLLPWIEEMIEDRKNEYTENLYDDTTEMKCTAPPDLPHGTYEILGGPFKPLTIHTLVTYSCKDGYELSDASASNLTCVLDQANDTAVWKGKMPSCQNYSQCGFRMENVGVGGNRGKTVGGEKSIEPWPWMAALYMSSYSKFNPVDMDLRCGGSIVHRNFILTAAHCMFNEKMEIRNKHDIIVKLGLTDVKNLTYVQEYEVHNIFLHPKYRPVSSFDYDIALLELERPIEFNGFVRPICLPPAELPEDSTLYRSEEFSWATGWGHQGVVSMYSVPEKMELSQVLKELLLPIQPIERCKQSLVDLVRYHIESSFFTSRMFCAGDGKGGNGTCSGDNGGPLMQPRLNAEGYLYWTQVGIVSWGIGCGQENTYNFFTHVQQFRPWIDTTIGRSSV